MQPSSDPRGAWRQRNTHAQVLPKAKGGMTTLTAVTSPLSTMACACSIHVASSTALYRPCPVPQWDPGNHCHVLYPRGGAGRGSSAADAAPAAAAAGGVARVATAVNTSQLRTVYC
eukprot:COSAG03_NODE_14678_length_456_cov_0.621849_1_plen_115_part_10